MEYLYAGRENYEAYASGRVIYHKSGLSTFPVRLASELFMRCRAFCKKQEALTLYDPLCGEGYLLTVLGILYRKQLAEIIGSDINEAALTLARENVSLLEGSGLTKRRAQLQSLYDQYQKPSHLAALETADTWLGQLKTAAPIVSKVFTRDLLQPYALQTAGFKADILLSDVPYGSMTTWSGGAGNEMDTFLENLLPVLHADTVLAIISDKAQKIHSPYFQRLKLLRAGKRKVELLKLNR